MMKNKHTKALQSFILILLISLIGSIFMIESVDAYTTSSFQLDTAKQLELKSETNYGTITLKDRYYADLLGWFDKDLGGIKVW